MHNTYRHFGLSMCSDCCCTIYCPHTFSETEFGITDKPPKLSTSEEKDLKDTKIMKAMTIMNTTSNGDATSLVKNSAFLCKHRQPLL